MKIRCPWSNSSDLMRKYHDEEWGVPVHDEQKHFEFLLLECMQAGLSWSIILNKRESFRRTFAGFDCRTVASFTSRYIDLLMLDRGIIRNRKKLEAAVGNASCFMDIQREYGSFDAYLWGFTEGKVINHRLESQEAAPTQNWLSHLLSKDMKQRGFRFVGSTTLYAHLQAVGVIQDHMVSCFRYREIIDRIPEEDIITDYS